MERKVFQENKFLEIFELSSKLRTYPKNHSRKVTAASCVFFSFSCRHFNAFIVILSFKPINDEPNLPNTDPVSKDNFM